MEDRIKTDFATRFGGNGTMYASAGRINLIGEHTDYNGGFVFPGAIDKCIMADHTAQRHRPDTRVLDGYRRDC